MPIAFAMALLAVGCPVCVFSAPTCWPLGVHIRRIAEADRSCNLLPGED
jgi:hypothetical protein